MHTHHHQAARGLGLSLTRVSLLLALGLTLLSPGSRASASGLQLPALGPTNTGVTTTGPLSVHFNPAGLGYAKRLRVVLGGDLVLGSIRYQRVRRASYQTSDSLDFQLPIDPGSIDASKTGPAREVKTNPIGLVPSFFIESPVADLPIAVGFGIDAPYAAIVRWPGAGPQRYALNDATLATVFMNAAVAYKPLDWLSLGAGVSYVLGYADLSRTQDLAGVQDLGTALGRPPINQPNGFGPSADPAVRELDTFSRPFQFNNGWASGVTFKVGALAEVAKNLFVAASYEHSTRLNFRGTFRLDMNNPFFTQDLASQGLDYPATVRGKASLSFTLPKVVRLGVRYGFGRKMGEESKYSVALETTFTGWGSVNNFDVRLRSSALAQPQLGLGRTLQLQLPRDWRNTYGALVRVTHAPTRKLSLWTAVGGESAAVPDSTIDAASPDGARVTVTGGLSRSIVGNLRILLDLTVQTVLKREVTGSDYDLANGKYKMFLVAGGAYADYAF